MQPSSGREPSHCFSNLMRCDSPEPERHSLDICWSCSEGRADQPPAPRGLPSLALERKKTLPPARCMERAGDCFLRQNEPRLGPRGRSGAKGAEGPPNDATDARVPVSASDGAIAASSRPHHCLDRAGPAAGAIAFPQKINVTETHVVTVLPRHTLSSSPSGLSKTILCRDRGAVEPLATGLPRLGALSVHGR
jgi:hypothetical protein